MGKYLKNHAKKNILTIIQSGLVIILIVLVMLMMVQIRNLQGTARVLNYAGLVRGATQREIAKVRENGYENTDIVKMSETYFGLADDTVSAAERYSETIASRIRWLEIFSVIDMVALGVVIIQQTVSAIWLARKNKVLEQKAYIDLHTGLPNKSRCEERSQPRISWAGTAAMNLSPSSTRPTAGA